MPTPFPPATLALADGAIFKANAFGAPKTAMAEIVFNTSMTGYQEIITDPSYCGQFVVMTAPHIGNTGINPDDMEAGAPWAAGLFVREVSRITSNYRAAMSLPHYLAENDIPGLTELDTRALVRHIRSHGAMMAAISSDPTLNDNDLISLAQNAPSMDGRDLVKEVTCAEPYHWTDGLLPEWKTPLTRHASRATYYVVAYDFGVKHNILRCLAEIGCNVTVVPAHTPAESALALKPDGIFLSNGPGDPAAAVYAIETVQKLLEADKPIFGICLGHQILALALGGRTHKMKFGHRGGNQPVQENTPPLIPPVHGGEMGGVSITSHNHGFTVTPSSLPNNVEVTHINLNDGCIEGLRHREKPVFSVQYHPEASPGPHDALGLFGRFVEVMEEVYNE